jgi:HAMP domain-containing protein
MNQLWSLRGFVIGLVTLSVLATSLSLVVPLSAKLKAFITDNATKELRLQVDKDAQALTFTLSSLTQAARILGQNGDVKRGVHSALLVGAVENQLRTFKSEWRFVRAATVTADDGRIVASISEDAEPALISTDLQREKAKWRLVGNFSTIRPFARWDEQGILVMPIAGLMNQLAGAIVLEIDAEKLMRSVVSITNDKETHFRLHLGERAIWTSNPSTISPKQGAQTADAMVRWSQDSIDGPNLHLVRTQSDTELEALVNNELHRLYLTLVLGIALFGGLTAISAHWAMRPLGRLRSYIEKIADGQFDATPPQSIFLELTKVVDVVSNLGTRIVGMIAREREQERRRSEMETLQIRTELSSLRNQMNPHFLFNSLNSISVLIDLDPALGKKLIGELAEMYRVIVDSTKELTQPLSKELRLVDSYLSLEKARFGDRLRYHMDIAPASQNIWVPTLILQTLVENSVKHGIATLREGGVITIRIHPTDSGHWMEVENPVKPGSATAKPHGTQTGLANTQKRLDLLYGSGHHFRMSHESNGTVRVSFQISGNRI